MYPNILCCNYACIKAHLTPWILMLPVHVLYVPTFWNYCYAVKFCTEIQFCPSSAPAFQNAFCSTESYQKRQLLWTLKLFFSREVEQGKISNKCFDSTIDIPYFWSVGYLACLLTLVQHSSFPIQSNNQQSLALSLPKRVGKVFFSIASFWGEWGGRFHTTSMCTLTWPNKGGGCQRNIPNKALKGNIVGLNKPTGTMRGKLTN